ncbi:MAG: histidine triad nucleotide-binding protein [Bdellovibrionota bacterium]
MDETIFDKIIAKKIPADLVYEDEDILAFKDINPQAPVHVLVIPKKKIGRFAELGHQSTNFIAKYFIGISKVAEHLGLEKDGYRVIFNNGEDAGQEVEYIHAHILAGRRLQWPPG